VCGSLGMQSMFKPGNTGNTTLTADGTYEHFDTWSYKLLKMVQVGGPPTLGMET